MKKFLIALPLAFAFGAANAADIVDTAKSAGTFNTLVTAVQAAGLTDTLKGPGPFTVFAPTDAAFAKIPKAKLDALLKDKAALTKVLTYHVLAKRVPGTAAVAAARQGASVKTVQGERIKLSLKAGKLVLNGTSRVIVADVMASNGVIHAIDTVLVPPSAS